MYGKYYNKVKRYLCFSKKLMRYYFKVKIYWFYLREYGLNVEILLGNMDLRYRYFFFK